MMSLDPVRAPRAFVAGAGGLLPLHARGPAVRARQAGRRREAGERRPGAAEGRGSRGPTAARRRRRRPCSPQAAGARREYWIQAEQVKWNIVPTGRDADDGQEGQGQDQVHGLRLPRLLAELRRAARAGDDPGAADRGRGRRHDRRQLPQQARRAGDDPPARRSSTRRRWTAPTRASTPTPAASSRRSETSQYVWEATPRDRGRLALPRPRADGPDAASTRACSGR